MDITSNSTFSQSFVQPVPGSLCLYRTAVSFSGVAVSSSLKPAFLNICELRSWDTSSTVELWNPNKTNKCLPHNTKAAIAKVPSAAAAYSVVAREEWLANHIKAEDSRKDWELQCLHRKLDTLRKIIDRVLPHVIGNSLKAPNELNRGQPTRRGLLHQFWQKVISKHIQKLSEYHQPHAKELLLTTINALKSWMPLPLPVPVPASSPRLRTFSRSNPSLRKSPKAPPSVTTILRLGRPQRVLNLQPPNT